MATLKTKTTIHCDTCGCSMKRVKSIKVEAEDKALAIEEANAKLKVWRKSLEGQNCKVCQSIINDVKAGR